MDVVCAQCGQPIASAKVDEVLQRAFCVDCDRFTPLAGARRPTAESIRNAFAPTKEIAPLPRSSFEERLAPGGVRRIQVGRRWLLPTSPNTGVAAPFVFATAAACVLLLTVLIAVAHVFADVALVAAALMLLPLALMLGLALVVAAGAIIGARLGAVSIEVEGDDMVVALRRIASHTTQRFEVWRVAKVDVVRVASNRGADSVLVAFWDVRLTLDDGTSVDLDLRLDQPAHANFVASRIEAALARVAPAGYRGERR